MTNTRDDEERLQQERAAFFAKGSTFAPVAREEIVGIDPILERIDELVETLRAAETLEHLRSPS